MHWPEKPTCHQVNGVFYAAADFMIWRLPGWRDDKRSDEEVYRETFRTCGYCGSIHPEDLLAVLRNGATLHGSDWKYGWPHKFYVEGIPNPMAGTIIPSYTYCGLRDRLGPTAEQYTYPDGHTTWREKRGEYPAPSTQGAKWYNVHLQDAGYDDAAFTELVAALALYTGIVFKKDEKGELMYAAPSRGYQR